MIDAVDIHVKGIVQGVGFRPFVYRMAKKYLINGWVLNATDGVHIHAEGESALVDEFIMELSDNAPAASKVEEIDLWRISTASRFVSPTMRTWQRPHLCRPSLPPATTA